MATDPKNKDEYDDYGSSAADEPTAMWTEEMMRAAEGSPEAPTAPATPVAAASTPPPLPGRRASTGPVSHPPLRSGARRVQPANRKPEPPSLSWTGTIVLAVALGAAVYYVVRLLMS